MKFKEIPAYVIKKTWLIYVLDKNFSSQNIKTITDIFLTKSEDSSTDIEFTTFDITSIKYTPLTLVNNEHIFNHYKSILRPNWLN